MSAPIFTPRRRLRSGWPMLAAVALVASASAVVLRSGPPAETAAFDDAGLVHVHALAEDPQDQSLLAATHNGLFRIGPDSVARVGDAMHDLMGFTAAAPGDFVASGHPDLRDRSLQVEGLPPLLGLVQSSDGEDWRSRSLLGEVDFHSLEVVDGTVYGWDASSGTLMVSADRQNWQSRAPIALSDFTVGDGYLLAVDGRRVLRSTDDGATWEVIADQPLALVVDAGSSLIGADRSGAVLASEDRGQTWTSRGTLGGSPEALLFASDRLVAAVQGLGIVASDDGGASWQALAAAE